MPETIASLIWNIIGLYLTLGLLFAIPFILKGIQKSDEAAAGATVGFRLIIIPGVILFWPMLAKRWVSGATAPPEEKSPHRTG